MWPFTRNASAGTSYALIQVGPDAVRGGLVWHRPGEKPALCATAHTLLPMQAEAGERVLERAIEDVGNELVCNGSPALRTLAGSGKVEEVIVALEHPWAIAAVETKTISPGEPFTYTRSMQGEVLAEPDEDAYATQKLIAATLLNGYLTPDPFGKRANHAELVVFSSRCHKDVAVQAEAAARRAFHANPPTIVPFGYVATRALQTINPHLKDFLILSITSAATEIVSVKRGHVVDAATGGEGTGVRSDASGGTTDAVRHLHPSSDIAPDPASALAARPAADASAAASKSEPHHRAPGYVIPHSSAQAAANATSKDPRTQWIANVGDLLKACATRHALPRTVFLIAESDTRAKLAEALNDPSLHALWLSDEPVTAVALSPDKFSSSLTVTGVAEGDTALALLALYASGTK